VDNINGKIFEKGLVSVVIPSFNREETITSCINSILTQTYQSIEVIVVDDCSQDNTEAVIASIQDGRVYYYKLEKNQGACFARNYGAKLSRGEFIAFQDSDDIWYTDKLQKQYAFLQSTGNDFVFCGMKRIGTDGNSSYYPQNLENFSGDFFARILEDNCISTQTMFMKREVMNSVTFDISFKRFQDWDFALRVAKICKVGYLPEALVESTVQTNSISRVTNKYEAYAHLFEKYEEDLIRYPRIYALYQNKMGDALSFSNRRQAGIHYAKSLQYHSDFRIFSKWILSKIGLLGIVRKKHMELHY
jgi:glycosyltransferase involved in cell wall biosynthesis